MVPMPPRTLDMVASPGRCEREGEAQRAPGGVGAPIGGVDRQEAQHAADLGVLDTVGEVPVDDVHDAAEHGGADRLTLGFVGGAGPHLVE